MKGERLQRVYFNVEDKEVLRLVEITSSEQLNPNQCIAIKKKKQGERKGATQVGGGPVIGQ